MEEPKVFDEKENRLESECEKQNHYTIAEPHEVYYAEQKSGSLRRKRKRTGNPIVQWLRGMGKTGTAGADGAAQLGTGQRERMGGRTVW